MGVAIEVKSITYSEDCNPKEKKNVYKMFTL